MSCKWFEICALAAMMFVQGCRLQAQTHATHLMNPPPRVSSKENSDPCYRKLSSAGQLSAYNVTVPPHGSTLVAPHAHDYLLVALKKADLKLSGRYGNGFELHLEDGGMQVVNGGWAHQVLNLDETAAVLIEIDVESGIRPARAICGLSASECSGGRFGKTDEGTYSQSTLFETPSVKLTRVVLGPGGELQEHSHSGPEILVPLTPVHLAHDDGARAYQMDIGVGEVHSFAGPTAHRIKNVGSEPAQFLEFERK